MGEQVSEIKNNRGTKLSHKKLFYVLLVLIVIAITAVFLIQGGSKQKTKPVQADSMQNIVTQTNILTTKNDYTAAIELLKQQIAVAKTPADKFTLENQLIATYINAGQPENAIKMLEQSLPAASNKGSVYRSIAQLYQSKHDTTAAIKYYKLAIANWSHSDPLYNAETNAMKATLTKLEQAG